MIDSHCHLNFDSLKNNIENVLSNAKKNNVTSILSINTEPQNFLEHYRIINNHNSIYISYGLHPCNVTDLVNIDKDTIVDFSTYDKVIAIGETGLDFYHSTEFLKPQYLSFEQHIEASIITGLPLVIHQRSSENEIIEVLRAYQKKDDLKLVLHCFTGTSKLKNFCLDNNYYISISGIITFKNSFDLRETIKDIPLSSLLIETDSPYLAPIPMRGKINEPSYVKYTGDYLANFFKVSVEEITKFTDDNFYKLFSKAIRYNKISE